MLKKKKYLQASDVDGKNDYYDIFPKHTKQPLCIRGVFNIIFDVFSSQQQQRKLLTLFFTQTQQMK